MIAASLIILAVLSYLGSSLAQLTSVFGMGVALSFTKDRSVLTQVGFLVVGSLVATISAEVIHVSYHAWEAARGIGDPDHGSFFMSAVLVGLINCVAMGPALAWTEWRRRRRAREQTT